MTKKQKRYVKLEKYKGIYKDTLNNSYLVRKVIDGKEYSKTFMKLSQASKWRSRYHPSLPENLEQPDSFQVMENVKGYEIKLNSGPKAEEFLNGRNLGMRFSDLVQAYKDKRLPSLSFSTNETFEGKITFFSDLYNVSLHHINHFYLDKYLAKKIKIEKQKASYRLYTITAELKILKAVFNWYRNNYDPSFFNPVLPRHKDMGIIRIKEKKNKKMRPEEVLQFFGALEGIWKDLAMVQFYLAGRIQEAAGIQRTSVNFQDRSILIKDVIVWNKKKKFQELKGVTKNGDVRYVYMNDVLTACLERRLSKLHPDSQYMFHIDGEPLHYRSIQYQYNKALKACGLHPRFSSTHFMRHSMGTITRMVTGNLDAAQAVTGHKDIRMVQHYANLPSDANKDAVNQVEEYLKKLVV